MHDSDTTHERRISGEKLRQEIFERIYTSMDIDSGIQGALERVGKAFDISRVYIFENTDDNRHSNNTFEWCNSGIEPQKDMLQNMSFEEFDYRMLFDEQGLCFCPDVSTLSEKLKDLFESQAIRATLQYAMYSSGVFRGFVGFDDCAKARPDWQDDGDSLDTLIYISRLLSIYLLKERNLQRANRYHDQLEKSLEEERRLRKEALRATEAKTRFLSNVSHDMRTPLNGIIGFTRLALETRDMAEKDACLEKIDVSGKFLIDLINETLDLSKIETGKITLNPEIVSSVNLLKGIVSNIAPLAEAKNIRLHVDDTKASWMALRVDVLRIQEICSNLLSNAVKFTADGGDIYFAIECMKIEESILHEKITIRDTGIGMSPEFLAQAFEPFTQERPFENQNYSGTGLGLSIVKQLVQLMDGTIDVQSEYGKGTTFTVCLKMERAAQQSLPQKADNVWPGVGLHGRHLLVCEDHPINAELIRRLLEKKHIAVTVVPNGSEGVRTFSLSPVGFFDAVLMDIRMPVMDGIEAAAAIRNLDRADAAAIPIIAMTANVYDEDKKLAEVAGMNAHLAKPVDTRQLYQTIADQITTYRKD